MSGGGVLSGLELIPGITSESLGVPAPIPPVTFIDITRIEASVFMRKLGYGAGQPSKMAPISSSNTPGLVLHVDFHGGQYPFP